MARSLERFYSEEGNVINSNLRTFWDRGIKNSVNATYLSLDTGASVSILDFSGIIPVGRKVRLYLTHLPSLVALEVLDNNGNCVYDAVFDDEYYFKKK